MLILTCYSLVQVLRLSTLVSFVRWHNLAWNPRRSSLKTDTGAMDVPRPLGLISNALTGHRCDGWIGWAYLTFCRPWSISTPNRFYYVQTLCGPSHPQFPTTPDPGQFLHPMNFILCSDIHKVSIEIRMCANCYLRHVMGVASSDQRNTNAAINLG